MVIARPKLIRYAKKKYKTEESKFISIIKLEKVLSALEEVIAEELIANDRIKLDKMGTLFNKKYRFKGQTFNIPKFRPSKKFIKEIRKPREVF